MSNALESSTLKIHQDAAFAEVKTEFSKYFEALTKHPRLLVGTEVPAIGREGMETLRDSADAKEWQDAIKSVLSDEIRSRAEKALDADAPMMQTLNSSIELFQNNADLVPGTKQFDKELADQLIKVAKPYELRVNGKLHGFTIPIQPLVDQLRSQITAGRATAKAQSAAAAQQAAPGSTTGAPAKVDAPPAAEAPQAGIRSRAGASSEAEDYSTLWSTLGLSNMRI